VSDTDWRSTARDLRTGKVPLEDMNDAALLAMLREVKAEAERRYKVAQQDCVAHVRGCWACTNAGRGGAGECRYYADTLLERLDALARATA
jgi:hypothetical protein